MLYYRTLLAQKKQLTIFERRNRMPTIKAPPKLSANLSLYGKFQYLYDGQKFSAIGLLDHLKIVVKPAKLHEILEQMTLTYKMTKKVNRGFSVDPHDYVVWQFFPHTQPRVKLSPLTIKAAVTELEDILETRRRASLRKEFIKAAPPAVAAKPRYRLGDADPAARPGSTPVFKKKSYSMRKRDDFAKVASLAALARVNRCGRAELNLSESDK
jgi:hypothetical protein